MKLCVYAPSALARCTHCSYIQVITPSDGRLKVPVGSSETFADVENMVRNELTIPESIRICFEATSESGIWSCSEGTTVSSIPSRVVNMELSEPDAN